MNRTSFLKHIVGLGLFSLWSCQTDTDDSEQATLNSSTKVVNEKEAVQKLRQELKVAWARSEKMTIANVEQMPAELFTFKYTEEAMTFTEQWRHCVKYTCGQLAANTDLENPYEGVKLPVQMPKEDIMKELKNMYSFIKASIDKISDELLLSDCDFAGDTIPVWRLFYALENHIIHHRGQCIVYLRLNGIKPKGFYG
ncbi:MAG: DinB family protein, partial [Bacteroidota bacterium]